MSRARGNLSALTGRLPPARAGARVSGAPGVKCTRLHGLPRDWWYYRGLAVQLLNEGRLFVGHR